MTDQIDRSRPAENGSPNGKPVPHVRVAIVGGGFAGLGVAIRLRQEGIEDFVVLEAAADTGGTWRDNTYPGCRCDVPSHLYSFSYAPNPNWSSTFSPQAEIWDYMRDVSDRYGITEKTRCDSGVQDAAWNDELALWELDTAAGSLTADVLVWGAGILAVPKTPELPGLESFEGTVFHSATWNHDYDLTGRNVAVIGTGASAIQFVPQIQPRVGRLSLFQRTAPWVMPRPDRPLTAFERRLYRAVPAAQRAMRAGIYWGRESSLFAFMHPRLMKITERIGLWHLRKQVPDPVLRAKLTPNYTFGCKRVLISDDYYPSLTQPNVDVVTSGIRAIGPESIVTDDGTEHVVDTIIMGTGFHVTDFPSAHLVHGRDGRSLGEVWGDHAEAYRGCTVAGFPNLFWMVGPNCGLGHSSIIFMIEAQANYVVDALRVMDERRLASVEVRRDAQDAFNRDIQERLKTTVWNTGGCASWYIDASGRNSTIWPRFTWQFRQQTRRFDPVAYRLRSAVLEREAVGVA